MASKTSSSKSALRSGKRSNRVTRSSAFPALRNPYMRRQIGSTVSGPIYLTRTKIAVALPSVAFSALAELAARAVSPTAKVNSSWASRFRGREASNIHSLASGFVIGSYLDAPSSMKRFHLSELYRFIVERKDATGLESVFLSFLQSAGNAIDSSMVSVGASHWNQASSASRGFLKPTPAFNVVRLTQWTLNPAARGFSCHRMRAGIT